MTPLLFNSFLGLLLCIPAVTLLTHSSKRASAIASTLLSATMAVGAWVAGVCWLQGVRVEANLSTFAPLRFALAVDRLSAFFLLLICVVAVPVVVFSSSYIERHYQGIARTWLWTLLPCFLLSMVVVVTASTAITFLFGWEAMTLVSAGLAWTDGDSKERRHNLFIYLLMMHAGAAAVIAAFMLFLPQTSLLDFASMRAAAATMPAGVRTAVFLMAFLGFGTKAGIVPLHLWLPKAHPIAPTPVSALMSGVMLKTAVYGFVRFSFDILGTGPSWWGYVVVLAGALTGVLGILYAIEENSLKRLLAYSSVENIGIIYLGLGTSLTLAAHGSSTWAAVALSAALLHSLNHALFKSMLFLGAGAIADSTHTLNIEELGGLQRRIPVTGSAFLIACCSIIGLPLTNGFISEWLTFQGFLAGATLTSVPAGILLPLMIGVLALIGGLAATCFAKLYAVAFLGRARSDKAASAHSVPKSMRAAMVLLAAACVAIGVFPAFILRVVGLNAQELLRGATLPTDVSPLINAMPWIALAFMAMVVAGMVFRRMKSAATWACGMPGLDSRMQYTATAFSKPVRRVFANVYKPERVVETQPEDSPYFPTSISYRSVRTTSFERTLYRPTVDAIVGIGYKLRRLQTGNIQVYLLYVFLALIGVLLFMRFA